MFSKFIAPCRISRLLSLSAYSFQAQSVPRAASRGRAVPSSKLKFGKNEPIHGCVRARRRDAPVAGPWHRWIFASLRRPAISILAKRTSRPFWPNELGLENDRANARPDFLHAGPGLGTASILPAVFGGAAGGSRSQQDAGGPGNHVLKKARICARNCAGGPGWA